MEVFRCRGETCDSCYDICENLVNRVKRLNRSFEPKKMYIEIRKLYLIGTRSINLTRSCFGGIPIEDIPAKGIQHAAYQIIGLSMRNARNQNALMMFLM